MYVRIGVCRVENDKKKSYYKELGVIPLKCPVLDKLYVGGYISPLVSIYVFLKFHLP